MGMEAAILSKSGFACVHPCGSVVNSSPVAKPLTPIWILCVLCVSAVNRIGFAAERDWPQFRGPGGQGISDAVHVPVDWSAEKNVAWKVAIPGSGWSSPVLAGGRIYLTTATNEGGATSLRALCLDADNGKTLWDVEVFRPEASAVRQMHPKNSPASATPIVTADRLFVHFGPMGTAALDLSGKIVWRQTELNFPPVHGNGGSPALVGPELIFKCDGGPDPLVAALDAATGQIRWKTPRSVHASRTFSLCTPLPIEVDGATQVISPGSGMVGAYDPQTGKEIWRVRYGEGYSVVPRPIYAEGVVILSSGFDTPELIAIRPQGAHGDVTDSQVAWRRRKGAPNTPSPLAVEDRVYCVSDAGIVTCGDVKKGTLNWSHRLDGNFSASPVYAEGRIYFQSEEGVGYVVEPGPEFKLLASNSLGERSLASYAVTDGAIFIRTEGHLWRIGAGAK